MEDRDVLFGLHEMKDIGWKTILHIAGCVNAFTDVLSMSAAKLMECGVPRRKAERIERELNPSFIRERRAAYLKQGIRFMTILDGEYPYLLKQTSQPPWVLYYTGDVAHLEKPAVAMVGTRVPTSYGKRAAEQLACSLSQKGFCIISGLAKGIDSAAHKGALRGKGSTVAVLGTGIGIVYPAENLALYREIGEKGLILSEYPLGTQAHPGLFPMRNRIIAGLGLGTVVVEAALRSGSLITADQSLDESRDVFAVPGPITSPNSQGTNALIRQGAKIVTCAEDIVEEYKHRITIEPSLSVTDREAVPLSDDERFILTLLSSEPTSIDELLTRSKFQFGHLHSVLLNLLMKRQIEQLPGSTYILSFRP